VNQIFESLIKKEMRVVKGLHKTMMRIIEAPYKGDAVFATFINCDANF
jgi:hypothetical protein